MNSTIDREWLMMATLSDWVDFSSSKNRQISAPKRMMSPVDTAQCVPGDGIGVENRTWVVAV